MRQRRSRRRAALTAVAANARRRRHRAGRHHLLTGTVSSVTLGAAGASPTLNTPQLGPVALSPSSKSIELSDSQGAHNMSFGIALSGLDAAQSDLNVTANNIANSATTGFKSFAPRSSPSCSQFAGRQQHPDRQRRAAAGRSSSNSPRATSRPPATAWIWRSAATASSPSAAAGRCNTRAPAHSRPTPTATSSTPPARTCRCTRPPRTATSTPPRCTNLQIPTGDSAPAATTTATLTFNLPAERQPRRPIRRSIPPIPTATTSRPR